VATPTAWHHSDPELWPSTAQASALLVALETLARLQEHIALTMGGEPMSLVDRPDAARDSRPAKPGRSHAPRRLFRW
jgi:hypothetical protein